ncbi:hypothetical protein MPS_1554 [Mycobacterium pseudoshottsii JCM 15466]|nr:hypothetical protein MMSP_4264 [Mycobacterium sp. 012931]GAQ33233.1 hypothetical protein MPS_1554 [Mycobacterium pseudoshottsii JCM 15466]
MPLFALVGALGVQYRLDRFGGQHIQTELTEQLAHDRIRR